MANDQPRARQRPGPRPGTEAARRSGMTAKAKYGRDFCRKIGKFGGAANMAKHGSEHYAHI